MLNVGGVWTKLKPPPDGGFTVGMAGLAAGVNGAADPAPKANTPLLLPGDTNPPELPNWKPPSNINKMN